MLRVISLLENLLILVDVTEEDKMVDGGPTSKVIQILFKSYKLLKFDKSKRFEINFLSFNASNILFNLSLDQEIYKDEFFSYY